MSKNTALNLPKIGTPGAQRKISVTLDAELAAEMDRYGAAYKDAYGEVVEIETLIPHMLRSFIAGDRSFKRWKSEQRKGGQ
ncbi:MULTISPECIES: DUF2274 domain-containing protein [Sphingomonadaceae]|uniref:Transposase n=1 Tax=Sphingobium baderi TaxID=1332080 RepID=A0A0S3F5Z3_9SPHN|nr:MULTISPECIES: DUF2274 domain-containing protein [Sphingomonadaceae]ALR23167.1 hypothetical protein ATN00_21965 [Sphingobium baderi]CDO34420.1 hypothetical protein SPHV1_1550004 [Novosphingobium sp. KN65.2]